MTEWKKIEKNELEKIMVPFETKGERYGKRQAFRARSMRKMVSLLQNGSTEDECASEIGVSISTIQSWRTQLEKQREKIIIEAAKERKRLKEMDPPPDPPGHLHGVRHLAGALFRALRTTADPDLAHAAEAEVRQIASQNVITELKAGFTEVNARINAQSVRIQAIESRIEDLRRVIWPLIVLLAAPIFGLLYKALWG